MTWPVALLLAVVTLFAAGYVGAIITLLGEKLFGAIARLASLLPLQPGDQKGEIAHGWSETE
jgi:hypothetical protein